MHPFPILERFIEEDIIIDGVVQIKAKSQVRKGLVIIIVNLFT
jgi:hypothetical protein